MSDPRYRVARHLSAPPDAVRAALAAALDDAGGGAALLRPPRGVRGVRGRVRGDRFNLWPNQRLEGDETELAGMIVPAADGGSQVRASVRDSPTAAGIALGMMGVGAVIGITAGPVGWLLAGLGAASGIVTGLRRAAGAINHGEAAYLVAWLNAVLDPLAGADDPHPTNPPLPGIQP